MNSTNLVPQPASICHLDTTVLVDQFDVVVIAHAVVGDIDVGDIGADLSAATTRCLSSAIRTLPENQRDFQVLHSHKICVTVPGTME